MRHSAKGATTAGLLRHRTHWRRHKSNSTLGVSQGADTLGSPLSIVGVMRMPKSQRAASSLRVVTSRPEALYRGYRIEGTKEGECIILCVIPTRGNLPNLAYSRFRSLPHGAWPKAVEVVCDYIDEALGNRTSPLRSVPHVENERSRNSGLTSGPRLPTFRL